APVPSRCSRQTRRGSQVGDSRPPGYRRQSQAPSMYKPVNNVRIMRARPSATTLIRYEPHGAGPSQAHPTESRETSYTRRDMSLKIVQSLSLCRIASVDYEFCSSHKFSLFRRKINNAPSYIVRFTDVP